MLKYNIKEQGLEQQINVSIKDLLDSGAHFGHQKRRWNPKMKRFILEEKGGLYIIDLAKTLSQLRKSIPFLRKVIEKKKSILFVGTKKQAKNTIKEVAEACGEFYVCERWLGGILTNMTTIRNSVKTLEKTERLLETKQDILTKKELALLAKKQQKLDKNLSGIRSMKHLPGLLIIVDPSYERIAVAEANKLGIPVLALVDTNCNPDPITHIIPCNDDSLKSIKVIISAIKEVILSAKKDLGINFSSSSKEDSTLKSVESNFLSMKYNDNEEERKDND